MLCLTAGVIFCYAAGVPAPGSERAARGAAEAAAVHGGTAGGGMLLRGRGRRIVDLCAGGVGVVVLPDPELQAGTDVIVGFGLDLGRLHPAVQDAADDGGNAQRDADHDQQGDQKAAAVIFLGGNIDGLAVLGVVVQRVGAQVNVGLCGHGVIPAGQQGNDFVLDLPDAVVGKGCDPAAIGDGDILAGAEGDHEENAALAAAGTKAVFEVIVFGKTAGAIIVLCIFPDAVHREEVDIAVMAVAGGLGGRFQRVIGIAVEQAVLVPHQRGGGKGRKAQTGHQQKGGQKGGEGSCVLLHVLPPPYNSISRASTAIRGRLIPANHAATRPLSTGRSPMSFPV